MNNADKPLRKSSVDKYFKALQELYYKIVVLGESNFSLHEFATQKIINNQTGTTLKSLGIIEDLGTNKIPNIFWKTDKPTKKMAEMVVRANRERIRDYEVKKPITIYSSKDRRIYSAMALQGLLSANNSQSPEYLAIRAVECADELLKQLENK